MKKVKFKALATTFLIIVLTLTGCSARNTAPKTSGESDKPTIEMNENEPQTNPVADLIADDSADTNDTSEGSTVDNTADSSADINDAPKGKVVDNTADSSADINDAPKGKVADNTADSSADINDMPEDNAAGISSDNIAQTDGDFTVIITESNSWESNNKTYVQYDISIKNNTDRPIKKCTARITVPDDLTIDQYWNFEPDLKGTTLSITPADYYYYDFAEGATINGMGMIVFSKSGERITGQPVNGDEGKSSDNAEADTTDTDKDGADSNSEDAKSASVNGSNHPDTSVMAGPLHVQGTQLADADNNPVQLRGVSTHGLAWYPEYVNEDTFRTLRDDWNVDLIRLAMYTEEFGGYTTLPDKSKLISIVDNGVKYATELGMYIIIDWHILHDGNPNTHLKSAREFFDMQSRKYASNTNVLYEICNEPNNAPWSSHIKPYAEEIVKTIRANDSDAIIIVGTDAWCQSIDEVSGDMLDYDNIMYAAHFYAAAHKEELRSSIEDALNNGVPVFISECSICNADGNYPIDYDSADDWMEFINRNNISYVFWGLCNKNEAASLIANSCTKLSDFTEGDLSETGRYYMKFK